MALVLVLRLGCARVRRLPVVRTQLCCTPSLRAVRFRWPLFRDILRVGAVAALVTVTTNLTIVIGTAFVGEFGPAAIAGYGIGARLEYLLVPLVFGLGGPLVAMVGTSIGAGQRERALRAAWIGAAMASFAHGGDRPLRRGFPDGLALAVRQRSGDARGRRDLSPDCRARSMASSASALALYFASQGAGRLLWPLLGNLARLAIAALAGWLALRWTGELSQVFLAQSVGLIASGFINLAAVAGGAWFGSLTWPWSTAAALQRRSPI